MTNRDIGSESIGTESSVPSGVNITGMDDDGTSIADADNDDANQSNKTTTSAKGKRKGRGDTSERNKKGRRSVEQAVGRKGKPKRADSDTSDDSSDDNMASDDDDNENGPELDRKE